MKATEHFFNELRKEVRENAGLPEQQKSVDEALSELHDRLFDGTPHIISTMRDIQMGTIRYTDVDWKKEIIGILRFFEYIPTYTETITWLWTFLSIVKNASTRIDILHEIKAIAPQCYDNFMQVGYLVDDCDSLIYINRRVIAVNLNNNIRVRKTWSDDKAILNDLAFILHDQAVEPKDLVAIAERVHRTLQFGNNEGLLETILKSNRLIGETSMDNIVEFVKNLYIAESLRQTVNDGFMFYMELPKLKTFDRKLRKACFDLYIESSVKRIEKKLDNDTSRIDDPDELECYQYLLEQEKTLLNNPDYLEAFTETPVYDGLWYPGKEMIEEMITSFIPYLEKKIAAMQPKQTAGGNTTIIVEKGDYVNGDKNIGVNIEHVDSNATGAIINQSK